MVRILGRGLCAVVTVTAAAGTACRDSTNPLPNADVMPPVLGTLVVSTSTTGAALDPDGYTVTVDGTLSQPVGTSGSVTFDSLVSGPHRVELAGVAENCTVIGANPQTDSVPAGDTARAAFAVSCASVRIIGLGQIQDAWTPPSWWDEFNFDVRSDLTGKLVYNEHWYRTDGSYVTLVVDPSDPRDRDHGIQGDRDRLRRLDPGRGVRWGQSRGGRRARSSECRVPGRVPRRGVRQRAVRERPRLLQLRGAGGRVLTQRPPDDGGHREGQLLIHPRHTAWCAAAARQPHRVGNSRYQAAPRERSETCPPRA